MKATILHVDGREEEVTLEVDKEGMILSKIYPLIGETCDCVDFVRLRRRNQVMLVDDNGYAKQLPLNARATKLYHDTCIPGTTNPIVGNVVLLAEEDLT